MQLLISVASQYAKESGKYYTEVFNEIQNALNNTNLSNEAKIQLLGELDYDNTEQTIENQIKELAQKQLKLEMKARIAGLDESFQVALDSLAKDEFLGVEELSSLIKDNINIAFEEASGHSKDFAEAMILVTANSSFIEMKSGNDDLNHSFE